VSALYGNTAAAVTGVNVDGVNYRQEGKSKIQTSQVQKDVPTMQLKSKPGHGTSNRHAAGRQKGAQNFSKEDIVELL